MAYLTERQLNNTLDVPVNLPSTEIKMGDWLIVASIKIAAPMRLTYRFMNLQLIAASVDLEDIRPVNRVNPNLQLAYVGLYFNYISGSPGGLPALDALKTNRFGVVTRSGPSIIAATAGTYSWIAVNNMKASGDSTAIIPVTTSIDFRLNIVGQTRIEIDAS